MNIKGKISKKNVEKTPDIPKTCFVSKDVLSRIVLHKAYFEKNISDKHVIVKLTSKQSVGSGNKYDNT